jgi:dephospho-CoA kinase
MQVVGLTGGIGSGKSAACNCFISLGVPVVDADRVARLVVEPGSEALARIAAHFGDRVILPDGRLDRAALRQIVFADAAERRWLEGLLHPRIRAHIQEALEQLEEQGHPYAILASPLLLETDQQRLVDTVVVVDLPEALQISRTMARDGVPEAQVRQILAAQMGREERRQRADFILDNSGDEARLRAAVEALHAQLLQMAQEER